MAAADPGLARPLTQRQMRLRTRCRWDDEQVSSGGPWCTVPADATKGWMWLLLLSYNRQLRIELLQQTQYVRWTLDSTQYNLGTKVCEHWVLGSDAYVGRTPWNNGQDWYVLERDFRLGDPCVVFPGDNADPLMISNLAIDFSNSRRGV